MFGELREIILEVLGDTLGPLKSYTSVTFLTDTTDIHCSYLHEPYSSHYWHLQDCVLEVGK